MTPFEIKQHILDRIRAYPRVLISRHIRPDGDAVGASRGLQEILLASFPGKEVLLVNRDTSDFLRFLNDSSAPVPPETYRDALLIVLDTSVADRVDNPDFTLAKEIIRIDHHADTAPFGDFSWVEPERSSACEMIADLFFTFENDLKITPAGVEALYAGLMTDSGRYRFSVSGETLRLGARLIDLGVDTETLFARLYMTDFSVLKFNAFVTQHIRLTENGVAWFHVTTAMREKFAMSQEDASATVTLLSGIRDSLIWAVFIDNDDGSVRVRLRSRFVAVRPVGEKYHGGGHDCASGATVYSRKEMNALLRDCDALLADYKANHEGWL